MKRMNLKTMIGACLSLIALAGCTQQSATSYTLTGHIDGLPDGTHVQLIPVSHTATQPIADTIVVDGRFVFQGKTEEPRAMRLAVKDAYAITLLMLENGKTDVVGKAIRQENNGMAGYRFSDVAISGSPLTDQYLDLCSVRQHLDSIYQVNNERFAAVRAAYGKAYGAKDKEQMATIAATEDYKAAAAADSVFFATVESAYHQVVMDHKDSFWGPLMMITLFSYLTEEQKAWYDALSDEAKQSYYGQMVKEQVDPSSKVGTSVPAFTAKSRDGQTVSLAELCAGKRYILIDFWASWCNPCRKEIPRLKKLYALYADRGFQIVSISIDKKEAEWTKALQEEQLPWPNFLDTEGIADLYQVRLVPTMYLIDAQGVTVGDNLRGEALEKKLAELFTE